MERLVGAGQRSLLQLGQAYRQTFDPFDQLRVLNPVDPQLLDHLSGQLGGSIRTIEQARDLALMLFIPL